MVTGYRVDPAGVQGVLADTAAAGVAIARAVRPLDGALRGSGAASDGDGAGLISAALRVFDEHVSAGIDVIAERLPAAANGLHGAAAAVSLGDEAMASQIHAHAAGVLESRTGNGRWAP